MTDHETNSMEAACAAFNARPSSLDPAFASALALIARLEAAVARLEDAVGQQPETEGQGPVAAGESPAPDRAEQRGVLMPDKPSCGNCEHFVPQPGRGVVGAPSMADGRCGHPFYGAAAAGRRPWRTRTDWCERHEMPEAPG